MYASFFLYGIAQFLLLTNWIAGSAFLVAFSLMYLMRVGREEEMMRSRFGSAYDSYQAQTKRLLPKIH